MANLSLPFSQVSVTIATGIWFVSRKRVNSWILFLMLVAFQRRTLLRCIKLFGNSHYHHDFFGIESAKSK